MDLFLTVSAPGFSTGFSQPGSNVQPNYAGILGDSQEDLLCADIQWRCRVSGSIGGRRRSIAAVLLLFSLPLRDSLRILPRFLSADGELSICVS